MGAALLLVLGVPAKHFLIAVAGAGVVAASFYKPHVGLGLMLVAKPLLDTLWAEYLGPLKFLHWVGFFVLLWGLALAAYLRPDFSRYKLKTLVLLWFGLSAIHLLTQGFSQPVLQLVARRFHGALFYFLVPAAVLRRRHARTLLWLWALSSLAPALLGLWGLISGHQEYFQVVREFARLKGPYHDAAALGTEVIPGFLIGFYLWKTERGPWKGLAAALTLLTGFVLFRTYTRAFWAAGLAVCFLWTVRGVWPTLAGALALFAWKWSLVWKRLTTAGLTAESPEAFLGGRWGIWRLDIEIFKGLDPFSKLVGIGKFAVGRPHNQFMETLLATGLVGLGLFTGLLIGLFLELIKGLKKELDLAFLGLTTFVFFLTIMMTGQFLTIPNLAWLFFGLLSLGLHPPEGRDLGLKPEPQKH